MLVRRIHYLGMFGLFGHPPVKFHSVMLNSECGDYRCEKAWFPYSCVTCIHCQSGLDGYVILPDFRTSGGNSLSVK